MQTKKFVKQTMNFFDCSGNIYQKKCAFELHNGVLSVYDCPAVMKLDGYISYGAGNQVFIQPGFEDIKNKELFNRKSIQSICKTCDKSCGR